MNIGFIVDHPKRDLAGAVRVAHAFAQRGASTYLIPLYDQGIDIPLLKLDALIINYARPINLELIKGYVGMGIAIFVLDTEGGILSEEGANSAQGLSDYIRNSDYSNLLDGYLFWGSKLRDTFAEKQALPENQLCITGCPRFDYASPRWRDLLSYEHHGYILVNANFPLVNPRYSQSVDGESRVMLDSGWGKNYVKQMVTDQNLILKNYLQAIIIAAKHLPDLHFLIRPHPFESINRYQQAFSKQANISIDGSGDVLSVIQHAACVLHLNCGTSIEASMLQRLPISMEFLNTQHMSNHSTLPSKISYLADSQKTLHKVLQNLHTETQHFNFESRYHSFIHPYFHANDGASGERVVEAVLERTSHRRQSPSLLHSLSRSLASSRAKSRISQHLQACLANLLGSAATAKLRALKQPLRCDKFLILATVQGLLDQLSNHENSKPARANHARHPITRATLSSLLIKPTI